MRVLIVDDHSLFRDGIGSLLQAAGFEVVGGASNGQEAIEVAMRLRPELILMDVSMPEMNGIEAARQIKAQLPGVKIVMLTVSDDDRVLIDAVKAGASGYLLKSLDSTEFLSMLEGVQRGESAMQRQTMSRLLDSLSDFSREPTVELTMRELELLRWVAQGYSNKAIAKEMSISANTVKYHMKSVLQKLSVQNRAEAVATAIRAGWLPAPAARV
ncbi:MAG: response regulator transcription factor [Chloroflexi bacterium]|nr:response regulator transcription factor [Chloroflexota bacterium]